jgi:hypothetical protein
MITLRAKRGRPRKKPVKPKLVTVSLTPQEVTAIGQWALHNCDNCIVVGIWNKVAYVNGTSAAGDAHGPQREEPTP